MNFFLLLFLNLFNLFIHFSNKWKYSVIFEYPRQLLTSLWLGIPALIHIIINAIRDVFNVTCKHFQ